MTAAKTLESTITVPARTTVRELRKQLVRLLGAGLSDEEFLRVFFSLVPTEGEEP